MMKALDVKQMERIEGGGTACKISGSVLALGVLALGAGLLTGGVGFFVAGGIAAYTGTTAGIYCAISG